MILPLYLLRWFCGRSASLRTGIKLCLAGGTAFPGASPENYRRILEPVYLNTFKESFQLALTSTAVICLIGYPWLFYGKASGRKEKESHAAPHASFWCNSLIRLYGWIIILQTKGC